MEFTQRHNYNDIYNISALSLQGILDPKDTDRLRRMRRAWNFYDGFHWEEIPEQDKPEVTENYCRVFVNKFVAFEFGKGFTVAYSAKSEGLKVNNDETQLQYMNRVWSDNHQDIFSIEMGQMKSVTGEAWVQTKFYKPDELDDPMGLYPKGRVRVMVVPSNIVFPEYDVHDKDKLVKVTIMYPIEKIEKTAILGRTTLNKIMYKQEWTRDKIVIHEGANKILDIANKYKVIPFTQIKNYPVAGRTEGISDLEDLIPLNVELNMKKSDISEIIDYHAAPVTIVFGARIANLEKGANKLWGGLPKDAKVQNLELNGDLRASVEYVADLKNAMNEVGGVPQGALGGTQSISNTSGVALQFVNLPIIEKTRVKRMCSVAGIQDVNRMILHLSLVENLISIPEGVDNYSFFYNEVTLADTLPKDTLMELQSLDQEMKMQIESREGALERIGREDIKAKLAQVDEDKKNNPDAYGIKPDMNSGMTNGSTPVEQVRKEINGANKSTNI